MKRTISREEHHRRSKAVCSWLVVHYHLSRRLVAQEANFCNPDVIYDAIGGKALIPKKNLDAIEKILKIYGYVPSK
jgi:hypothetical protein